MSLNHEILQLFFPAMFSHDRSQLEKLLTDDVEWHLPPFVENSELKGKPAILEFICGTAGKVFKKGSMQMDIETQAVEGDQALVLAQLHAKASSGKDYRNRYCFAFHFREGAIYEVWELMDSVNLQQQLRN